MLILRKLIAIRGTKGSEEVPLLWMYHFGRRLYVLHGLEHGIYSIRCCAILSRMCDMFSTPSALRTMSPGFRSWVHVSWCCLHWSVILVACWLCERRHIVSRDSKHASPLLASICVQRSGCAYNGPIVASCAIALQPIMYVMSNLIMAQKLMSSYGVGSEIVQVQISENISVRMSVQICFFSGWLFHDNTWANV